MFEGVFSDKSDTESLKSVVQERRYLAVLPGHGRDAGDKGGGGRIPEPQTARGRRGRQAHEQAPTAAGPARTQRHLGGHSADW